jgi:hypothetical protein
VQGLDPLGLAPKWWHGGPEKSKDWTIVCDNKGGIRVHPGTRKGLADADKCIYDCLWKHEVSHMMDALTANPLICFNKRDNTELLVDNSTRAATERRARQKEMDCLNDKLDDMRCPQGEDSQKCSNAVIKGQIKLLEKLCPKCKKKKKYGKTCG